MKIDYRKHYILLIDIETANIVEDGIAYDIGFIIADTKGNIFEKGSYMVAEMFLDNKELMETAYYSEKLPLYWKEYHEHKRQLASIYTIKRIINNYIYQYKIKEVFAYNCYFDKNGLNRTIRYLTKSKTRWFFPYGLKYCCIWNMACQTIFKQAKFRKMALHNLWYNMNSMNVQTTAEIGNRYLTNDIKFSESHTGLEDVLIEYQILLKCLSYRKIDKSINRLCWQIPQKKFKEFAKKSIDK